MTRLVRAQAKINSYKLPTRTFQLPTDGNGRKLRVSEFFGENVFDFHKSEILTKADKDELVQIIDKKKELSKDVAEKYANAVLNWATAKSATHFTHWFQPLTGSTAEKHDAFLSFDKQGLPIEKLSATQLIQGEPDASSFPHGGSRSTFEARGYTSWDLTSPIFIKTNENGKTLCIPTAFVSYHGDALDIKTPLLRSITQLSKAATKFINTIAKDKSEKVDFVDVTAGCEQEYFLVDKALYFERPDLVMSGRTLFGAVTSRNQQLEDHYFGTVPDRVMAYMQEVEIELYKLGVPAKTRHNEVAPGQFELAPIFNKANVAADQNQVIMAVLQSVAPKHGFVCLLHEKPFAGINGSGKHLNWAMSDSNGNNLLEPTDNPHINYRFLAFIAMICEAVNRHGASLRASIASHGNDHRLGANEAPPSIISIFMGDTLTKVLEAYASGKAYENNAGGFLDLRADQLARLVKDNTDRNRTSPFAFTGNKFEFRAVGSSANVGIPMTVLNSAVADVINDMTERVEKEIAGGTAIDDVLKNLITDLYKNSHKVVFNGDGYSQDWQVEAEKRGLPNLKTSAEALEVLKDKSKNTFLTKLGVYTENELMTRYNVRVERYVKHREIEFQTLVNMIHKDIIPATVAYKKNLADSINAQKTAGVDASVDAVILKDVNNALTKLHTDTVKLTKELEAYSSTQEHVLIGRIAHDHMPLVERIAETIAYLEENVSEDLWGLPTYYDMLFIR